MEETAAGKGQDGWLFPFPWDAFIPDYMSVYSGGPDGPLIDAMADYR